MRLEEALGLSLHDEAVAGPGVLAPDKMSLRPTDVHPVAVGMTWSKTNSGRVTHRVPMVNITQGPAAFDVQRDALPLGGVPVASN
jgi:hypothetical protein